jgi:hypothetical protein
MHHLDRTCHRAILSLVVLAACGKPMDRSGREDASFVSASMTGTPAPSGPDRPLASDLAVEPVSMLVMFNRLKTPEALQDALNKKPGQFSHVDIDQDSTPDPLTVAARETPQGHAFEIRARPNSGEFVVATMVFDPEWSYLGHYNGVLGGGASTVSRPLPATPLSSSPPVAAIAPAAPGTPTAAVAEAAASPTPVAGVQAVPAGDAQSPGLAGAP